MNRYDAANEVNRRFEYKSDPKGWFDAWSLPKDYGKIEDDCDGYGINMLYVLSNKSMFKFVWLLVTFQACFWKVWSPAGNSHAVLWYRGQWIDNIQDEWYYTEDMIHEKRYPYIWPVVLVKLGLTYLEERLLWLKRK